MNSTKNRNRSLSTSGGRVKATGKTWSGKSAVVPVPGLPSILVPETKESWGASKPAEAGTTKWFLPQPAKLPAEALDSEPRHDHSAFHLYLKEIGETKLLTPKEEVVLAKRIKK